MQKQVTEDMFKGSNRLNTLIPNSQVPKKQTTSPSKQIKKLDSGETTLLTPQQTNVTEKASGPLIGAFSTMSPQK